MYMDCETINCSETNVCISLPDYRLRVSLKSSDHYTDEFIFNMDAKTAAELFKGLNEALLIIDNTEKS